jgi:hypothetical protein
MATGELIQLSRFWTNYVIVYLDFYAEVEHLHRHGVFPFVNLRMLCAQFLYDIINLNPWRHDVTKYFLVISYYSITYFVFSDGMDI